MKENKKEVSFMEEKQRDIFAQAREFLRAKRSEKDGCVEEIRAVRIEDHQEKEKNT